MRWLSLCCVTLGLTATLTVASPLDSDPIEFAIEAQGMAGALRDFARQAAVEVVYEQKTVAEFRSPGLSGVFLPREALDELLADTPLAYRVSSSETVSILREEAAEDREGSAPRDERERPDDLAEADAGDAAQTAGGATSEENEGDSDGGEGESDAGEGESDGEEPVETIEAQILVTASKRGEVSAQDLAVSMTAFDTEKIERLNAISFEDLIVQVPSTNFIDNGGPGRGHEVESIRGLSPVADNTISVVANYLDGAPRFGRNYRLFDIGEVSVLRGPQGTLWGSQAIGGLISYRSNRPSPTRSSWNLEADVSDTVDSSGLGQRVTGHVNVPVVEDKLALRFAGQYISENGYIDNIGTGTKDINDVEETAWRLSALYEASETVTLTAIYHGSDLTADAPSFFDLELDDRQVDLPFDDLPADQEFDLLNLGVEADLEWADLSYTGSYFKLDNVYSDAERNTFGFIPLTVTDTILEQDSWTHELRLASNNAGRFNWVAGLFFDDLDEFDLVENREVADPANPGGEAIGDGALIFSIGGPEKFTEKAVFGELMIDLGSDWELLLGGRYFDWEVDNDQDTVFLGTGFGQEVGTVGDDDSFFKVQVTRRLGDDKLVFATRSEGFRFGGFNPFVGENFNSSLEFLEFQPDRLVNHELGFRSGWAQNRVILNAALYQMDWEDVQTVVFDSVGVFAFTANASDLEAQGFEIEVATQDYIAEGVYANVGYSYNTNEFQSDAVVFPDVGSLISKGDELRRTPKNTWSADVGYDFLLSEDVAGFVRSNYWHKDATTTEGFNRNDGAVPIPAQDVVNASAGVYFGDWEVKLVVQNLTDEIPLLQVFAGASTATGSPEAMEAVRASSIRPRTIGLWVSFRP